MTFFAVATKRGTKIRHVQVESKQSQYNLQEEFGILGMLALPYEFQFPWHYWIELPMRPRIPEFEQFADVAFKVRSHLFYCHKVKYPLLFLRIKTIVILVLISGCLLDQERIFQSLDQRSFQRRVLGSALGHTNRAVARSRSKGFRSNCQPCVQ